MGPRRTGNIVHGSFAGLAKLSGQDEESGLILKLEKRETERNQRYWQAADFGEANMQETRRGFVWDLATMAGVLVVCNGVALGQTPGKTTFPKPPTPGDPQEKNKTADASDVKAMKQAVAIRNEKEFRAGVERLYQLSGELREEMQKTTTTNVLSVRMYKKTEEIEKLAKKLKNLARGS